MMHYFRKLQVRTCQNLLFNFHIVWKLNNLTLKSELQPMAGIKNLTKPNIQNQIAGVFGVHKKHQSSLSEFGRVSFKMRPFETKGGTQIQRVAMLNEGQATLVNELAC